MAPCSAVRDGTCIDEAADVVNVFVVRQTKNIMDCEHHAMSLMYDTVLLPRTMDHGGETQLLHGKYCRRVGGQDDGVLKSTVILLKWYSKQC